MPDGNEEGVLRKAERCIRALESVACEERDVLIKAGLVSVEDRASLAALPDLLSRKEAHLRTLLQLRPELESLRDESRRKREGTQLALASRKLFQIHAVNKKLLAVRLESVSTALSFLGSPSGENILYARGGREKKSVSGQVLHTDF